MSQCVNCVFQCVSCLIQFYTTLLIHKGKLYCCNINYFETLMFVINVFVLPDIKARKYQCLEYLSQCGQLWQFPINLTRTVFTPIWPESHGGQAILFHIASMRRSCLHNVSWCLGWCKDLMSLIWSFIYKVKPVNLLFNQDMQLYGAFRTNA